MRQIPPSLRIVSIESPYDVWSDPAVQQLFCRTLEMRLRGYGSEYGEGVFPLDGADFAGAHHLVCEETREGFRPLMGVRTTNLTTAKRHGLTFGGLSLARAAGKPEHVAAMEGILRHCEANRIEIAYIASWTMEPEVRKNPIMKKLMRELFQAISVLSHHETGTRVIGGCTMRFKMDEWFARWGFEPVVGADGVGLEPARVPFLHDEQVRLMYLKRFSPEILEEVAGWRSAWENRVRLDGAKRAEPRRVEPAKKAA